LLINDFAALAFAADILAACDLRTLGPELRGLDAEPVSIVDAGTGFGVSCLARCRDFPVPLTTEGGHIGFAPSDDQEITVLRALTQQFGRVSIERILSGAGLENLYRTLEML
jgi:glucokinase